MHSDSINLDDLYSLYSDNLKEALLKKPVAATLLKYVIPSFKPLTSEQIISETLSDYNPDEILMSPLFIQLDIPYDPFYVYKIKLPGNEQILGQKDAYLMFVSNLYTGKHPLSEAFFKTQDLIEACNEILLQTSDPELLYEKVPVFCYWINLFAPEDTITRMINTVTFKSNLKKLDLFETDEVNEYTRLLLTVINVTPPDGTFVSQQKEP